MFKKSDSNQIRSEGDFRQFKIDPKILSSVNKSSQLHSSDSIDISGDDFSIKVKKALNNEEFDENSNSIS